RAPQRRQAGPYDIFDVLGDYPEAVEADLIRNYPGIGGGDPLGAFFRGEITLRQLRVLVENLPPDCASATRERGHDWTRRDYLAAEIADATRFLYALTASAYGANVPAPEPIERPGDRERRDAEEAERRRSHDQVRAQRIPGGWRRGAGRCRVVGRPAVHARLHA